MVNNIKVISKIKIDLTPPNVAHQLPITPEKAIIQWARDCLSIAGNKNTARMIIIDAKAREISLDLDECLTGIDTLEPTCFETIAYLYFCICTTNMTKVVGLKHL